MSIECHEFFECNKQECIVFNENEKMNCWEAEPVLTPCTKDVFGDSITMEQKMVCCQNCSYYQYRKKTTKDYMA